MKRTAKLLKYQGKPLSYSNFANVMADLMCDLGTGDITPAEAGTIIKEAEGIVKKLDGQSRMIKALTKRVRMREKTAKGKP
jgi:hypothetical protein